MAVLYGEKNDIEKSENLFKEVIALRNQFVHQYDDKIQASNAATLNNIANLQKAKNEYEKAEQSYKETLEIYRKLAKSNPQTYQPYVAMTLNNLGVFTK
jgi:tetratricopeptide (TPR) repeat protein